MMLKVALLAMPAKVFRFYFRCSACGAEMTMKTDPEHADYTVEQGATRNYEPWREKDRCVWSALPVRLPLVVDGGTVTV